jgi:hypothetical protein
MNIQHKAQNAVDGKGKVTISHRSFGWSHGKHVLLISHLYKLYVHKSIFLYILIFIFVKKLIYVFFF